jgi:hypothetical protein
MHFARTVLACHFARGIKAVLVRLLDEWLKIDSYLVGRVFTVPLLEVVVIMAAS